MNGSSITPSSSSDDVAEDDVDVPFVSDVADVLFVVGLAVGFDVAFVVAFVVLPLPESEESSTSGRSVPASVAVVSAVVSSEEDFAGSVLSSVAAVVVVAVAASDDDVTDESTGTRLSFLLQDLTPITTPTMITRSASTPDNIIIVCFLSIYL